MKYIHCTVHYCVVYVYSLESNDCVWWKIQIAIEIEKEMERERDEWGHKKKIFFD